MIFEHSLKNKKDLLVTSFTILVLGIFIFFYSPVIFQEGNPWPQIKGIARLTFGNKDIVKLDTLNNKYITKGNNLDIIKSFMKEKGYDFTEQMGSGYFFTKDDLDKVVVTHKYYSRFYSLWNITENDSSHVIFSGKFVCLPVKDINLPHNDICLFGLQDEKGDYYRLYNSDSNFNIFGTINTGIKILVEGVLVLGVDDIYQSLGTIKVEKVTQQIDIKAELKECLHKSDIASHERCNELLATIRNFDDCVTAGFSIMKSNPPQCATPDGRSFTNEANSNWNIVLTAINNCEAESVFQTHSKLVTLKLKNGDKITAYEPQIDDVMNVVESLNGKCGHIRLSTE